MRAIANIFTRVAERYLPDAFIFVFFLTFIVFLLGLLKGYPPNQVLDFWGEGFFNILTFTAQSTLMLVTGFALAHTSIVNKILVAFAQLPKNEVQVIALTTLVMMVCSWFSWGFGLIAGAIVAREMGIVHRGKVHYPLVVAASYAGFIVWHAGYGGAIPTLIATDGHFLESSIGIIPVSQTIFSINTLIILFALVLIIPLTMVMMRPRKHEERRNIPESEIRFEKKNTLSEIDKKSLTPAQRIEASRFVPLLLGIVGCIWLVHYFITGGAVNLNVVIMTFFALGLLFTHSTKEYIAHFQGGAKSAYGIIMQFPFYAGIMGVMIHTGLAADIASMFVAIADANTLPFWGFISAGIVNMFVPSGGGQWAVQGPIMVEAATQLNADLPRVVMGVAWGDAWTNMLQPFWTLPLLAIAGLGIRDIMGYTAVVLIISGFVIGAGLLFI